MNEFDPIAYINEPRWQQSRYGLERTQELLNRLGRPQDRMKFVHVAGTNGKGSTCAFIESVLRSAGYKTGLFTSPYIITFEERIRVNGENISLDDLRDVTLDVREHAEAMAAESGEHPTEFELMTAVAFEHFARCNCDIAIVEVGLGGRLDSTNIIEAPEVCVITRIGLDHTELLGDTQAAIAAEKAGIIKPGASVVSWPQDDEGATESIRQAAQAAGTEVIEPDFSQLSVNPIKDAMRPFDYKGASYATRLLGSYQPSNAALALEAIFALRERGWNISDDELHRGIAETAWPARFEVVSVGPPAVVVDGGHNPQGAIVLAESLKDAFSGKRIVFLMSVLADKDYHAMIRTVAPLGSAWVCVTSPNVLRALSGDDLAQAVAQEAKDLGLNPEVQVAPDFGAAMEIAKELAGEDGVVCAWGSLYSVSLLKSVLEA